jgi:hypothetical protein
VCGHLGQSVLAALCRVSRIFFYFSPHFKFNSNQFEYRKLDSVNHSPSDPSIWDVYGAYWTYTIGPQPSIAPATTGGSSWSFKMKCASSRPLVVDMVSFFYLHSHRHLFHFFICTHTDTCHRLTPPPNTVGPLCFIALFYREAPLPLRRRREVPRHTLLLAPPGASQRGSRSRGRSDGAGTG